QKAALELVRQYTEVPAVGTDDVAEAEYEVVDLKKHQASRHRLAVEMGGHLIFPEVAAALSFPVEPVDLSAIDALEAVQGKVGMMLHWQDTQEGRAGLMVKRHDAWR
ncbi:hypothetical protein KIPB_009740, partial [Kipferlia bialata]